MKFLLLLLSVSLLSCSTIKKAAYRPQLKQSLAKQHIYQMPLSSLEKQVKNVLSTTSYVTDKANRSLLKEVAKNGGYYKGSVYHGHRPIDIGKNFFKLGMDLFSLPSYFEIDKTPKTVLLWDGVNIYQLTSLNKKESSIRVYYSQQAPYATGKKVKHFKGPLKKKSKYKGNLNKIRDLSLAFKNSYRNTELELKLIQNVESKGYTQLSSKVEKKLNELF